MKSKINLVILMLIIALQSVAQSKTLLPEFRGYTLNDKEVFLPKDAKGKYGVMGFAFSIAGQKELETWIDPILKTFGPESMMPSPMYIIPIPGMMEDMVMKKMKKEFDKSYHPYILFVKEGEKELRKALELKDKSKAYIALISPKGEIVRVISGAYSEKKIEEVADAIE